MEFFPLLKPCPLPPLPEGESRASARDLQFTGISFIESPRTDYLTFCDKRRATLASDPTIRPLVLVLPDFADWLAALWPAAELLVVDDPRATFIDIVEFLQRDKLLGQSSLLPASPSISREAKIGTNAVIETGVQVDAGVTIGNGSIIHTGTWVKRGATISDNCVIGAPGINVHIGQDGRRRSLPHVAGVIIGETTSLGAGSVIARGMLTTTTIGNDCILGNLCNIGHSTELGDDVWVSTGTCIAGVARIETGATIALGCVIRDGVRIGAHASIGMGSVVTKSIGAGVSVFGNPARRIPTVKAGPSR